MEINETALALMQKRGGTWYAYQNQAMDSALLGHIQFLQVGPNCTYKKPPDKYPADTNSGMGWRYLFKGKVDLESGNII